MVHQFTPPAHLSERTKTLWAELVPERARSAGRLALLTAGLEALDRADAARTALGVNLTTTTETTGAVHCHPLLKVEREARGQFAKIWADLGLGWDGSTDGMSLDRWLSRQDEGEA